MAGQPKYNDYAHIGPDTLGGKLLRRFWQPIMLGEELLPGRPRRVLILGEHFTAYRGDDGVAHVVADRCPHRSTMMSLGWVEGNCIRCFYHGWKFDPEGNCVDQPAEPPTFKDRVHIRAYPTREYLGLIFAYFGEGATPEFPLYPEADVEQDAVYYNAHPVPCNFFQRVENDLDELHLHFVHRVSTDEIGMNEIPRIKVEETEYGILRTGVRVDKGQNVTRTGRIFMPNTMMVFTPGRPSRRCSPASTSSWRPTLTCSRPSSIMNATTFRPMKVISIRRTCRSCTPFASPMRRATRTASRCSA